MNRTKPSLFSSWIFDSYSTSVQGLALFRIFAALFLLFFMLPSIGLYAFISGLPADFFSPPPGPMDFFNDFPSYEVFMALQVSLICSLLFMLAGCFTKIASLTTSLFFLILKGFIYSTGKIDHDILLAIVPLIMAFSGWGRAYSIDAFQRIDASLSPQNWTITLVALFTGFMFFTAGFPKILGGWLDIHSQAVHGHFLKQYIINGRQDLLADFIFNTNLSSWVWELFDYATVLFEVGFLVAIVNAKTTRLFVCFTVLFHFGTMLILNIAFLPNFLAYAAFLNWDKIHETIRNAGSNFFQSKMVAAWFPPAIVAISMLIIFMLATILDGHILVHSDLKIAGVIIASCSVPVAGLYLFKQVVKLLKKLK